MHFNTILGKPTVKRTFYLSLSGSNIFRLRSSASSLQRYILLSVVFHLVLKQVFIQIQQTKDLCNQRSLSRLTVQAFVSSQFSKCAALEIVGNASLVFILVFLNWVFEVWLFFCSMYYPMQLQNLFRKLMIKCSKFRDFFMILQEINRTLRLFSSNVEQIAFVIVNNIVISHELQNLGKLCQEILAVQYICCKALTLQNYYHLFSTYSYSYN